MVGINGATAKGGARQIVAANAPANRIQKLALDWAAIFGLLGATIFGKMERPRKLAIKRHVANHAVTGVPTPPENPMPTEARATDKPALSKPALANFAKLARNVFAKGKHLKLEEGAGGPRSLEWALPGIYPEADASSMETLSKLGVRALEFFPNYSGGSQQGYWALAHLDDGRRMPLALNGLSDGLDESSVSGAMKGNAADGFSVSRHFFNWACHNKAIFAEIPGKSAGWRLGRRKSNVELDEAGDPNFLTHPQAWDDSNPGWVYSRSSMANWWVELSFKLAPQIVKQLSPREREALTKETKKDRKALRLDKKIAAAFPESLREEARALIESQELEKEIAASAEKSGGSAPTANKKALRV